MSAVTLKNRQISDLMQQLVKDNPGVPVEIAAEDDRALGVFVPYYVSQRMDPPRATPEQQAEFERRLATIDDSIPHDEMVRLVIEDLCSSTPES